MPSDAAQRAVEVIDAAYAKATPGEWHAARLERMDEPGVQREGHVGFGALHTPHNARVVGANWSDDAQFIALAHNNWPAVRAHIAALTAENARLKAQIKELTNG